MRVSFTGLDPAVRKLNSLPFPAGADDDQLSDIVSDLSELASKILIQAGRAGRGEDVWPDQVPSTDGVIDRLRKLHTIRPDDVAVYTQVVDYLEALEAVRQELVRDDKP